MNPERAYDREFETLLSAMIDGTMSRSQEVRLGELLRDHREVQQAYLDFCLTHALLRQELGAFPEASAAGTSPAALAPSLALRASAFAGSPPGLSPGSILSGHFSSAPFCYTIAAMILGGAVLASRLWTCQDGRRSDPVVQGAAQSTPGPVRPGLANTRIDRIAESRRQPGPGLPAASHKSGPSASPGAPMPIVGRITGMSGILGKVLRDDIDRNVAFEVGTPVRVGWKFVLASGRLEMTYNSGAKVVIEGPAVDYIVEGENGGFLSSGKLLVDVHGRDGRPRSQREQVGKSAIGSWQSGASNPESVPLAHPVFIVRTPCVNVNDTDGEFAINIDNSGGSETQVLRGKVLWRWTCCEAPPHEREFILKEKYQARLKFRDEGEGRWVLVTVGRPNGPMRELRSPAPVFAVKKTETSTAN